MLDVELPPKYYTVSNNGM